MASVLAIKSDSNPSMDQHYLFFTLIGLIRSGPALTKINKEEKQGYIHMLAGKPDTNVVQSTVLSTKTLQIPERKLGVSKKIFLSNILKYHKLARHTS